MLVRFFSVDLADEPAKRPEIGGRIESLRMGIADIEIDTYLRRIDGGDQAAKAIYRLRMGAAHALRSHHDARTVPPRA